MLLMLRYAYDSLPSQGDKETRAVVPPTLFPREANGWRGGGIKISHQRIVRIAAVRFHRLTM